MSIVLKSKLYFLIKHRYIIKANRFIPESIPIHQPLTVHLSLETSVLGVEDREQLPTVSQREAPVAYWLGTALLFVSSYHISSRT